MKAYPTIKQLQYLQALFETKNFRKAAEQCFVTQPTLSSAIQELESTLSAPVLDRTQPKKVTFTAFGLSLIEKSRRITEILDNVLIMAEQEAKPFSGIVRVGIIPTIAPYLLPTILKPLQTSFPDMTFQIVEAMSASLVKQLKNNNIDVAVMAFPYEHSDLNCEILCEEPFYCATPKDLFDPSKQRISIQELKNQPLLLLEDGHCLREHALEACQLEQLQSTEKTLSATSLQTIMQMVEQGYGLTLLPEMMVKHTPHFDNIDILSFESPQPSRKIGLLWRKRDPKELSILGIIDVLKPLMS